MFTGADQPVASCAPGHAGPPWQGESLAPLTSRAVWGHPGQPPHPAWVQQPQVPSRRTVVSGASLVPHPAAVAREHLLCLETCSLGPERGQGGGMERKWVRSRVAATRAPPSVTWHLFSPESIFLRTGISGSSPHTGYAVPPMHDSGGIPCPWGSPGLWGAHQGSKQERGRA